MRMKEGLGHLVLAARTSPLFTAEEIKQDRVRNLRRLQRQKVRRSR